MNSKATEPLRIVINGYLAELVAFAAPNTACNTFAPMAHKTWNELPADKGAVLAIGSIAELLRIIAAAPETSEAEKTSINFAQEKITEYLPLVQEVEPTEPTDRKPLTDDAEPLTGKSDMTVWGPVGHNLALEATWAIEPMCEELLTQITEADVDTDTMRPCEVMRALTMRIKALNSVLMSGLTAPDITLQEAADVIYGSPSRKYLADFLTVANQPADKADFMAGVDGAIEMLFHAGTRDGDQMELDGTYRPDRPQDNVALRYLRELLQKPERAEGFAAVLSAIISPNVLDKGYVKEFATLNYERIMVPALRRDPETGLLPGEKFPEREAPAAAPKAAAKPKAKKTPKKSGQPVPA